MEEGGFIRKVLDSIFFPQASQTGGENSVDIQL